MGRENKSIYEASTEGCGDGGQATQEDERDIIDRDSDATEVQSDRDESRKKKEPRDEAKDGCDLDLSTVHGVKARR